MKKALCILLSLLMLSAVACSDTTDNSDVSTDTSSEPETVEQEPETTWADTIPAEIQYDGYEFKIGWIVCNGYDEYAPIYDEVAGDVVGEAVCERNRLTEAKLNITVSAEQFPDSWTNTTTVFKDLVLAGDTTYDVLSAGTWFMFQSSINGLITSIESVPTIDLSNIWWDQIMNEMTALGSKTHYMLNGHINYVDDYACSCLFFNKQMCTNLGLDMPYEMVRNGEWTFDKYCEYSSAASSDVDGNGVYDENDTWGIIENSGSPCRFLPGFMQNVVIVDETGAATVNTSESFVTQITDLFDRVLTTENHATLLEDREIGYDKGDLIFPEGRAMFRGSMVREINSLRESMEQDFGIIPYPKYDESQERYASSYNTVWGSSYAIPTTNLELDRTGWILETLGYYSTDTIYPASIEVNAMSKAIRDEDSAEMLRIIFDNKFYELGQWGSTVYSQICSASINGSINIASLTKSATKITAKEFSGIQEYYKYGE